MYKDFDTPLYYYNKYGILFYKDSNRSLSSNELSDLQSVNGFSTEGFYQLEKLYLTKEIKEVLWNGLGRHSFKRFEVDLDNKVFQEKDGVLYTKKGYDRHGSTNRKKMIELVACPTTVSFHRVLYGTQRIGNCAFKGSNISKLLLPNTLIEIGTNAFYFADRIESLEIPMSIQKIESQLARSSFPIRYDNSQFQSWEELFNYMVGHGFEMNNHKILKRI